MDKKLTHGRVHLPSLAMMQFGHQASVPISGIQPGTIDIASSNLQEHRAGHGKICSLRKIKTANYY